MSYPKFAPARRKLALSALSLAALPVCAQSLLLDNFAAPTPAVDPSASSQTFVVSTPGTYAGEAGQARDAYFWEYNPGASASSASVGAGSATVNAGGAGGYGELTLGYGAYAIAIGVPLVQGPALGLNLTSYGELQASFSNVNHTLNLIVGFYTSNPLPGGQYYWDGEINLTPAVPGGPATGNLIFTGDNAETFNFAQVDGIEFIVDRAAQSDGNVYSLTALQFTQAVPEPASPALLLAGLVAMGAWRQRRCGGAKR